MTTTPTDALLQKILDETKVIAAVGVSPNPVRPSYFVMRYLSMRGYRVIPINPVAAGQTLFGETVLASITDIPKGTSVDMVDIFRRPEFVSELVDAAITHLGDHLKTIWMQVGVEHADAAKQASDAGLQVIQNRCPKIECQRLNGELRRAGFNTGIISSKL
ncbi:MAG: CoA-binding protein [Proteobacteria bacterium]|nr:CoA-binding protein [Pseudomonadota bacterium]